MEGIKCRALGEVFECKGMKLRVARGRTCRACVFSASIGVCYASHMGIGGIIGPCTSAAREDNNDVIFILEEA